jgi:hypothetical protein
MVQQDEMSHEDKVKMYSKMSKKELVEMLIQANDIIGQLLNKPYIIDTDKLPLTDYNGVPDMVPFHETCSCNPSNGGSGICSCIMANKMVPNPNKVTRTYQTSTVGTTTDFKYEKKENEDVQ